MEFLKELFGGKALTFEELSAACTDKGYKLADLSRGEYVAAGKLKAESDKVKALGEQITKYETQLEELKASAGDSSRLQAKVAELEAAMDERRKADEQAAAAALLNDRFEKASAGRKYLNDYTRRGILSEFESALTQDENKGKSDAEIFSALVNDRDGVFASENPPANIPGSDPIAAEALDEAHVRAVMGLPPKN